MCIFVPLIMATRQSNLNISNAFSALRMVLAVPAAYAVVMVPFHRRTVHTAIGPGGFGINWLPGLVAGNLPVASGVPQAGTWDQIRTGRSIRRHRGGGTPGIPPNRPVWH